MTKKITYINITCKTCGIQFQVKYSDRNRLFCSRSCSSKNPDLIKQRNERTKQSQLIKYGGHPMIVNNDTKVKLRKSIKDKYGVEHALQNKDLITKTKQAKLLKYGDENYCNKDKVTETLKKLHRDNKLLNKHTLKQIENIKTMMFKCSDYTPLFNEYIDSKHTYMFKCNFCDTEFHFNMGNSRRPLCRCQYKDVYTKHSKIELEVRELLDLHNIEYTVQDRKILSGYEIDIVIEKYKLAIEVNGSYWHSTQQGKDKNYHINKTMKCNERGYQLIHILDIDWINKKDKIVSLILSKLKIYDNVYYARNFNVRVITDNKIKSVFLDENHLQGNDLSSIRLGLFNKTTDELMSVMTFAKPRFNNNYDYELLRFCNKLNVSVVGGFSKLFNYFINNYDFNSLITYSNVNYFNGDIYRVNKFTELEMTNPSYIYLKYNLVISRYEAQKHRLNKLFNKLNLIYDDKLTEQENMINNKFLMIYDCGNYKFEYIKK